MLSVLGSDQLQQPHQCLRLDLSRGWEGEWDGNVQTPHWLMIMLGMIKGSKRLLNTGHLQACREYYDYFVRLGYLLNPIDQYFMGWDGMVLCLCLYYRIGGYIFHIPIRSPEKNITMLSPCSQLYSHCTTFVRFQLTEQIPLTLWCHQTWAGKPPI